MTIGTVVYTVLSGRVLDPIRFISHYKMNATQDKLLEYCAVVDVSPLFIANGLIQQADANGNPQWVPK